ncbi:hypothetical protein [Streptomyces sp. E-08]|uniref:hypothetical protein n=1 Tax=Streptomyces sp. E-08 TaxID=3404047 RepID=UPI003CE85CBF
MADVRNGEQDEFGRRIREIVGRLVHADLDPAADAVALGSRYEQYDSLTVLDTVGLVEQEFGVSVDLVDDDLRATFASVTSIEQLVRRKLADQAVLSGGF